MAALPLKTIYRNKVVVVPYVRLPYTDTCKNNDNVRLAIFRDTASGDWTFVTGGCKLDEDNFVSASRELREESRNTLVLSSMHTLFTFSFQSSYRPKEHAAVDAKEKIKVITTYVVYIVKLPMTDMDAYVHSYKNKGVTGKKFTETNNMAFASIQELSTKYKMWSFMKDEIIPKVAFEFTKIF